MACSEQAWCVSWEMLIWDVNFEKGMQMRWWSYGFRETNARLRMQWLTCDECWVRLGQYARHQYVGELRLDADQSKLMFSVLNNSRKEQTVKRATPHLKQFCTLKTLSTVTAFSFKVLSGQKMAQSTTTMRQETNSTGIIHVPQRGWFRTILLECCGSLILSVVKHVSFLQSPQWVNHDLKILERFQQDDQP